MCGTMSTEAKYDHDRDRKDCFKIGLAVLETVFNLCTRYSIVQSYALLPLIMLVTWLLYSI